MNQIEIKEINDFVNHLKERGIPVIVEYQGEMPTKVFCKPPQSEWFGITLLEGDDIIFENEKYYGLIIGEEHGVIGTSIYDLSINGIPWNTLRIEDFDIYVQKSIYEAEYFYNIGKSCYALNKRIAIPEFDLETDTLLKDCFMDIYLKQQSESGIKMVVYNYDASC